MGIHQNSDEPKKPLGSLLEQFDKLCVVNHSVLMFNRYLMATDNSANILNWYGILHDFSRSYLFCDRCERTFLELDSLNMERCGGCKRAYYCSSACREASKPSHQPYCTTLSAQNRTNAQTGEGDLRPEPGVNLRVFFYTEAEVDCWMPAQNIKNTMLNITRIFRWHGAVSHFHHVPH